MQYYLLQKKLWKVLGEPVSKTKLKEIKFKCKSDRFLMERNSVLRGAFGFADYESGERRGSYTDSHFGGIINLILIHFSICYHFLMFSIDFIINYY